MAMLYWFQDKPNHMDTTSEHHPLQGLLFNATTQPNTQHYVVTKEGGGGKRQDNVNLPHYLARTFKQKYKNNLRGHTHTNTRVTSKKR